MLSFPGRLKIYVALEPCDMRKSFNTLGALVELKKELTEGDLFLFVGKNRGKQMLKL